MFTQLLGEDFLRYVYDKDKGTSVDEHILSTLVDYNHDQWESEYLNQPTTAMQDMPSKGHGPKHPTQDTSQKPAKKICLGNETSQKKVIILDEDDTEEANCSNNGSEYQRSSAISIASTRAELAALATLIPSVSSFAGSLSPMLGQGAGSDLLFTNPSVWFNVHAKQSLKELKLS